MNGKIFKSEFQRNDQNLKPNKLELREDVAKGSNMYEDEGRRDVTVTKSTRFSLKVAEIREVKHRGAHQRGCLQMHGTYTLIHTIDIV